MSGMVSLPQESAVQCTTPDPQSAAAMASSPSAGDHQGSALRMEKSRAT